MILSQILIGLLWMACGSSSGTTIGSDHSANFYILAEYEAGSDELTIRFENKSSDILNLDTCFIIQDLDHIIQGNSSRLYISTTAKDAQKYFPHRVDPTEKKCPSKYIELKPGATYSKKIGFTPYRKEAYVVHNDIHHFVLELALNYLNRTTVEMVVQEKYSIPFETISP